MITKEIDTKFGEITSWVIYCMWSVLAITFALAIKDTYWMLLLILVCILGIRVEIKKSLIY